MKKSLIVISLLFVWFLLPAQKGFYKSYKFTQADTLRGMLRPERTCYDVQFYDLSISIDPSKKTISGYNDIHFIALNDFTKLQIDLFSNMKINRIEFKGQELSFTRLYNAVFIEFPLQAAGNGGVFRVYYEGKPNVARRPPWDGGFVWQKDKNGDPWIGVACEGDGASLWWPNKDHLSDEPDSMAISVTVPKGLVCVSNGNLRSREMVEKGVERFNWFVSYPINNYNVTVNIAKYVHFTDTYTAEDGQVLECDYYVLPYNLEKAKKQFQQVDKVLACFERFFGKYPFWEDGYALVETPYLGMEHQSAIAYGNQYMRGYLGGMIPKNMDWDYIIIHETGHEWFGNSISCNDLAEMWIHESFTTYMEALYVECVYNYEEAIKYLASQRYYIMNEEPILGPKNVNWEDWKGSDHYYKGAWMLHTLRHAINDDALWFDLLKSFYQKHKRSNITTADFVDYVNACTKKDFTSFFEQYLEYPTIPTLEYKLKEKKNKLVFSYRWQADAEGFDMPFLVGESEDYQLIRPNAAWQSQTFENMELDDFRLATELFLIKTQRID